MMHPSIPDLPCTSCLSACLPLSLYVSLSLYTLVAQWQVAQKERKRDLHVSPFYSFSHISQGTKTAAVPIWKTTTLSCPSSVGRPTGRGGPEGFSGVVEEVTISVTKVKGEAAGYCLVTAERDG